MKNPLMRLALEAAVEAGQAILKIYEEEDFGVELKEDASPLTRADRAAHKVILKRLQASGIPVLSEEGRHLPFEQRKPWRELWIVDPVDGTKEFIKRNGEFTVNIALVRDGKAVLGVVLAPVLGHLYVGEAGAGAWRLDVSMGSDVDVDQVWASREPLPKKRNASFPLPESGCRKSTMCWMRPRLKIGPFCPQVKSPTWDRCCSCHQFDPNAWPRRGSHNPP